MARLPVWLPRLLKQIEWGCSSSPLLVRLSDDEHVMESGRYTCLDLWPFIVNLPINISAVRDALPPQMLAAGKLLGQLADDERYYQGLFIEQCRLAGLSEEDLSLHQPSKAMLKLCTVMTEYTCNAPYQHGINAIATAELAATAFARQALPHYERYFSNHGHSYTTFDVENGLGWLKHHAKPHTKQALWLTRMLGEISEHSLEDYPPGAGAVLAALLEWWQCPREPVSRVPCGGRA